MLWINKALALYTIEFQSEHNALWSIAARQLDAVFTDYVLSLRSNMFNHGGRSLRNSGRNSDKQSKFEAPPKFLGVESLALSWNYQRSAMKTMCRCLEPRVTELFQQWRLHTHRCNARSNGVLIVDGNAKIRTKLCANADDRARYPSWARSFVLLPYRQDAVLSTFPYGDGVTEGARRVRLVWEDVGTPSAPVWSKKRSLGVASLWAAPSRPR